MGEIRFVGTGETNGYPYLVCKKVFSNIKDSSLDTLQIFYLHVSSLISNYRYMYLQMIFPFGTNFDFEISRVDGTPILMYFFFCFFIYYF